MNVVSKPIRDRRFNIMLTEQEYEDLKKEADDTGFTISYIIREGVRLYFRRGIDGRNTSV